MDLFYFMNRRKTKMKSQLRLRPNIRRQCAILLLKLFIYIKEIYLIRTPLNPQISLIQRFSKINSSLASHLNALGILIFDFDIKQVKVNIWSLFETRSRPYISYAK